MLILSRPILLLLLYTFFSISFLKAEEKKVRFTENKGQWNSNINFRAKIRGGQVFLEDQKIKYLFYENNSFSKFHLPRDKNNIPKSLKCHAVSVSFIGSQKPQSVNKFIPFTNYENYFIGNVHSKWASNVLAYQQITYKNLYKDIDLEFNSTEQNFKYTFIVKPHAETNNIILEYDGAEKLSLSKEGNLVIKTSVGEASELKPYAFQFIDGIKTIVSCNYQLNSNKISYKFPQGYNRNFELIIDPTLVYVTYTGSTADNWGMTATYDAGGNAYTGGIAFDVGYPLTAGAIQSTFGTQASATGQLLVDMTFTKFDPTGSTAIYSTYFGGIDAEQPQSLVVNANNELIIYGRTISNDFPVTTGAYDVSHNGGYDIVVAKFNAAGTAVIGSTYIGGSGDDGVNYDPNESVLGSLKYNYSDDARGEIVLDPYGNIYIAASTKSSNFPVTSGAFQSSYGGNQDACILKFNPNLTGLFFSSFFGGTNIDAAYALALDTQNNIFVTGGTASQNITTTSGTLHPSYVGGVADGFLIKVNNIGSSLLASTYIGTASYDQSFFVQTDINNDVYLFGQTEGAYPVTAGVYKNTNGKQFIHKINNTLTTTIYSTIFGRGQAKPDIVPSAFLVDDCQNVYVSGWGGELYGYNNSWSATTGLPVTANAYKPTTDGDDFYLLGISKNALSLNYATFFGGNSSSEHCDGGTSRFDKAGMIYQSVCASCGGFSDLPTASGVWSQTNNSFNCNNAVIKFQLNFNNTIANFQTNAQYLSGCSPLLVNFQNNSFLGVTYEWILGDGTTSTAIAPSHTYTAPGTYNVMMIVTNLQSCNIHDTAYGVVTVHPPFILNPQPDVTICQDNSTQLNLSSPAVSYNWTPTYGLSNPTIANPVATPGMSTQYIVTATDSNGCVNSDTVVVNVFDSHMEIYNLSDTVLCQGETVTLSVGGGFVSQQWSNGSTGLAITTGLAGTYSVITTDTIGCIDTADMQVLVYPHIMPVISNDTMICEGDHVDLTASGGINYLWTPSTAFINNTLQTENVAPLSTTTYSVTISNEACSDTVSVLINVLPGHTDITANGSLRVCEGDSVTLDAGMHINYLWNTGNTNQSITVYTEGFYTVTTQTGTCFTSDTVFVKILPYLHAYNDTAICYGTGAFLRVEPAITNIQWTPSASLDSANSITPFATPINNTMYIVSSVDACKGDTVNVIVYPFFALTPMVDDTVCKDQTVQLNLMTSAVSYAWSPATGLNNTAIANPLASPPADIQYIVTATDNNGCTNSDTVLVSIVQNISSITNLSDTVLCLGESVTITVGPGYQSYQWNNGATTGSITTGNAGLYSVITTDNHGCKDTVEMQVVVYPKVVPLVSNDTSVCAGDRIELTAGGGIYYLWTPSVYFPIDTLQTQSATPFITTTYHVTISNEACVDSASITVNIYPNFTDIASSGPLTICTGDSVELNAGTHLTYLWNTGSTSQSITVAAAGLYTVTTQTGTCFSSDTAIVIVLPGIRAFSDTGICYGENAYLRAEPSLPNIVWTPSLYLDDANSIHPVASPLSSITYVVSAPGACKNDSVTITVHPNPIVNAGNDTLIIYGSHAYLNGHTNESNFWWTPSNLVNCDDCLNPKAQPDSTITFTLTAENSFGCRSADSVKVVVKDIPSLYVPNCITPNGDHINDVFRVYFVGITEIEVKIFNRWGQLIYSWNTLNGFWDATYKGSIVQEDVYVYTVSAVNIDMEKITKTGTVTVIK